MYIAKNYFPISLSQELFSVVILHYKQPLYWKSAISSVLVQNYHAIQIVFTDDATPGFPLSDVNDYIEQNKRDNLQSYKILRHTENGGTAANCDAALSICDGTYVLFLDGDDRLAGAEVLDLFVKQFRSLPESAKIISANCAVCDIDMGFKYLKYNNSFINEINKLSVDRLFAKVSSNCFPVPSSTAYRANIFQKTGGFKAPYVRLAQDCYFFLHATRLGEKIYLANFVAAKHRDGGVAHPINDIISNSNLAIKIEFLRIAEMEVFPYFNKFNITERETICQRYYENLLAYRRDSNDLVYGISEPAYTILKTWATEKNIPWFFEKSHIIFQTDKQQRHLPKDLKGQIQLVPKIEKCLGCSTCAQACPSNAIIMSEDYQGFLYPVINAEKCVHCNICMRVCPITHTSASELEPANAYAVKNTNESTRATSRSGGFFALAAEYVIKNGGIVYGAAFDNELAVHHIRITSIDKIKLLQGSKYVQSIIGDIYIQVQHDLEQGFNVLFSGTPCQIDGLLHFLQIRDLGIKRENLVTIDFVCHGAPSPKLFREYLDWLEQLHHGKIECFNFRDKAKGWRAHFESATMWCVDHQEKFFHNEYTQLYYQHCMFRPSCYECRYSQFKRRSDITIGDFWGIEKADAEFDDDKGISLVLPRTAKGINLFNLIKSGLIIKKFPLDKCVQPNLLFPSTRGQNYDSFWAVYRIGGLQSVIDTYIKNTPQKNDNKSIQTIGILTFHRAHNFGAMLQAWAMMSYLNRIGFKAEIINYRCKRIDDHYKFIPWQVCPRYEQFRTPYNPLVGIKMYLNVWKNNLPVIIVWWRRRRNFIKFMHKYLNIHSSAVSNYEQLSGFSYDAIICGSDQIWAIQDPAYYAAFDTNARRIAYAPSIGNNQFPPELHSVISKWINNFYALSVREKSLAEYITKIFGGLSPSVTLDPTLLLHGEDYLPLINDSKTWCNSKYVLVYCVTENDKMVDIAHEIALNNGLELLVIRNWIRPDMHDQIQNAECGPQEFLWYIKNATYVVTNSFHGTAFSILFHKSFYCVYENDQNNRIDNLLNIVGLEERHLTDALPTKLNDGIIWEHVDKYLDEERVKSYHFLDLALKSDC